MSFSGNTGRGKDMFAGLAIGAFIILPVIMITLTAPWWGVLVLWVAIVLGVSAWLMS